MSPLDTQEHSVDELKVIDPSMEYENICMTYQNDDITTQSSVLDRLKIFIPFYWIKVINTWIKLGKIILLRDSIISNKVW